MEWLPLVPLVLVAPLAWLIWKLRIVEEKMRSPMPKQITIATVPHNEGDRFTLPVVVPEAVVK